MAFFVQHFEQLITYLDQPGVPRTSNHAERANRHYRALSGLHPPPPPPLRLEDPGGPAASAHRPSRVRLQLALLTLGQSRRSVRQGILYLGKQ